MKKSLTLFAALALVASACGPSENTASNSRTKNNALTTSATATVPAAPPQIFLKIDTVDLTPVALQGTPKFVARLRWAAPLNDGGSPITGYDIEFRWNSVERGKAVYAKYKNWTSCYDENQTVPGSFPACAVARESTATSAEISSDYWQRYTTPVESHLVQGLEFRVAARNALGTGGFSPATQETCKYGGACEFGDLGPGGGVVYDVPEATRTGTGWTSRGASEVAGADWEYNKVHSWAAMVWAGETRCPGWSCYSPTPPQPCLKTTTTPVKYAANYETCFTRDAWHLPFAMPTNGTAEWRPLCNRFDDLKRTWGKLRGGDGFFYWSASNPIIPAGLSISLSVTNVVALVTSPGIGTIAEIAQENFDKTFSSSLQTSTAIRFPCDSKTKSITGNYDGQGRLYEPAPNNNVVYHDNSVRTPVINRANLSRPIRYFTTNKPAIKPQVAPRLTASTGDGGVVLSWTAGTPDTALASAIGTAQILPLTGYVIEYKRSSDSQWSRLASSDSVNMWRVIGNGVLAQNISYDFRVAEVNSLGTGPISSVATATPGKFIQSALTVTTSSGTFPGVDLATSGGEGTGVVTYIATNGTANGCAVQGGRLVATRTGTCNVVATKAGDAGFLAATSGQKTVTINPAPQSAVSITSLSSPFDRPLVLAASGGNGDGAMTFALSESDRTFCKLEGTTLTFTPPSPQTGTCRVSATRAASENYLAATSATTAINFTAGSQASLVIEQPATTQVPAQEVAIKARGGSGTGEAKFNVRNGTATDCAVWTTSESGGVITSKVSANNFGLATANAGTCIVTVTRAGDGTYLPATSAETTVTFTRGVQDAVILTDPSSGPFTGIQLGTRGGSGTGSVTYAIVERNPSIAAFKKAPNCRITGSTLLADARGICWVTATKAGDKAYDASSASTAVEYVLNVSDQPALNLTVSPTTGPVGANTKITTNVTGGAGTGKVEIGARNGTASGCNYSNGSVTAQTSGTCTIVATKAGDFNYVAATAEVTFTMTIGQQAALSIPSGLRGQALSLDVPVTLSTAGGSGSGAVSYTVTDTGTAQCSVAGNKLSARAAGQCSVSATKAGDASFAEAKSSAVVIPFDIRVGDNAEAGGTIAYVADTPQTWGRYIELAPANWNGATTPVVDWAAAFPLVAAYRGGGRLDWRLPSNAEKALMGTNFPGSTWTFDAAPGGTAAVRPIRTFG